MNVIIATTLSDDGLATFRRADDLNIQLVPPTREALMNCLPTAEALVISDEVEIDDELLDQAKSLKLIGRVGAALNGIDLDTATRRGIIVMNTPGVDAVAVAEYTFALMLALLRNVVRAHNDLGDGILDRSVHIGTDLHGKTLGIIGLGRVGREVASRAIAFGMNVLASDPYVAESQIADLRLKLVGFDEVLAQSHVISLHTSLVPDTVHLLNAHRFAKMRRGVYIVNVKHSQLINEVDLAAALDSGQVAGAALDVSYEEPLLNHPRVLHTLRMRDNTEEAQRDLSVLIAGQVIDALRGQDYRNAVNLPFMPGREYEVIQPQLRLGERIGKILAALGHPAPIKRMVIEISGDEMHGLIKPLTVAILKGLLSPVLGERVNYINAPVLAAERGIFPTQAKMLGVTPYPNLLSCQVIWGDGFELIAAGALFNDTEPRIVQLDHYRTDFTAEGILLVMGSFDVPGVIGKVGTFMADHNINIGGWRTSRAEKGGNTLTVLSIDEPLDESLMNELREKEFVRHLTQIIF